MQTIQHVLCPVDLSEPSAQALRYAAAFSSVVNADLTVLYVRTAAAHQRDLRSASHASLATFASNVIGVRMLERQGEPVVEILGTTVNSASDIIVMGTHGRTGLERLLLGSVAERVIRRSPIPVLAVPFAMATAEGSIRSVLCAVDLSEPSSRAVDYGASIAAAAGARLVLAHALEWSEETESLPGSGNSLLPSSEGRPTKSCVSFVSGTSIWSYLAFDGGTRSVWWSLDRRHNSSFAMAHAQCSRCGRSNLHSSRAAVSHTGMCDQSRLSF
jgi:nucleotide-binding universal stress UspA family protein/ribosomal protein L37E